jgi:hypothetical protein
VILSGTMSARDRSVDVVARVVLAAALVGACAPDEGVVAADAGRTDARALNDLAGDGPGDAGARDAAAADGASFDGAAADGSSADGSSADGSSADASSVDGASVDAGPRRCTVTPSAEPFRSPSLRLHWRATAGTPFPNVDQVCSTPVVADIVRAAAGEEEVPEVAFMTFSCESGYPHSVLRVISGRAPHRLLWSQNGVGAPNTETAPYALRWDGHPAVGDLDGNPGNGLEVVAVTARFGLAAFRSNGRLYWQSMEPLTGVNGANPSVSIADLDGDGVPEVIAGGAVLNGRTGAVRWQAPTRGTNGQGPLSVVIDLDGDGRLEVITGSAVYDAAGMQRFRMGNGEGFAAVGDLLDASGRAGADGVPEVAVMAGGTLTLYNGMTGASRWTAALQGASALGGAPTVADFDGDGHAEVGVAGGNRYTLFDPDCRAVGPDCIAVGVRWATVTEDTSSNVTSSTVFDFNGDGASEVVYNDEERFMVLDGRTGRVLFEDWNPSQTRTEQAIVADADGDGQADIIFGANQCVGFAGNTIPAAMQATQRVPGLEIWSSGDGSWVAARPLWNEHGYHIDNINDDGTIPRREQPAWRTHNTFRLNRARDRELLAPNLAGAPEPTTCRLGVASVCTVVRNGGDAPVGVVTVGVYDRAPTDAGARRLGVASTTRVLAPGQTDRVCVEVPAPSVETRLWVRVDDGGAARECDEGDNVAEVTVSCGPA